MAVVGDESLASQCVEIAVTAGLEVVVIASSNPTVRAAAVEWAIVAVDPGDDIAASLADHDFDVLLSVANLHVLPPSLLARAQLALNFHDGPLPGYAGVNVTTWALLNGERQHAVTWHVMTERVDAGDVVAVERFEIAADDTAFSLNARCYEAGLASFQRLAAALAAGELTTGPQPVGERRQFRYRDRPARILDFEQAADDILLLVRALDLGQLTVNRIGVPIAMCGTAAAFAVDDGHLATADAGSGAPGTVLGRDGDAVTVATGTVPVLLRLRALDGGPLDARHGPAVGDVLAADPGLAATFAALDPTLASAEAWWTRRATGTATSDLPWPVVEPGDDWGSVEVELAAGTAVEGCIAVVATWLARCNDAEYAAFEFIDGELVAASGHLGPLAAPHVARIDIAASATVADLAATVADEVAELHRHAPIAADAYGRDPATRGRSPAPVVGLAVGDGATFGASVRLELCIDRAATTLTIRHARRAVDDAQAARIAEQLDAMLAAAAAAPAVEAGRLPIVGPADADVFASLSATALEFDRTQTVDSLLRAQAHRTPDAPALSCGPTTLSYAQLDARVEQLAAALAAAGVNRGDRIGIGVPRNLDLVAAAMAALRRGAAYVPIDLDYPAERIALVGADAGMQALVTDGGCLDSAVLPGVAIVDVATATTTTTGTTPVTHEAPHPGDLAYVVYTSGSTGKPKGVLLEHRNVVNFFAAMDEVIGDDPGTWLAVTSLSFDISVLELFWTLARGAHVVLRPGGNLAGGAAMPARPVSLSLFYFAAGSDADGDPYRLLLDGARFADEHGFEAVWTPERHFHDFGGSYPNPSVTAAAVAAVTQRVAVRAGSVVAPLHSPVRIAEEWAVVDRLSGGRVGISFAPGWQPRDFVLNPAVYGRAKEELPKLIDAVQRLWRGESVELPGHDGEPAEVRTLPRPVQAELPSWLTSAGSPATFEQAGRLGCNVLTHLLGQSFAELGANIARYRRARADAGHAGDGRVTLMLHTYCDRDEAVAKEQARGPIKRYLGSAANLIKNMASAFPAFAGSGADADAAFESLSPAELDALLDAAATRYIDTSGMFGTPQQVAATIARVSALGVDEVACLIDFGVDVDKVLAALPLLAEAGAAAGAVAGAATRADVAAPDSSGEAVATLIGRHGVTHLQCTPSLAAMLVADPADRAALATLRHLLVGGEALPTALAAELRTLLAGRLTNMYGPTETTIWSLAHEIAEHPTAPVPIGRPIGNTTVHVLDRRGEEVPVGVYGELHIGGDGVARGYHNRPQLTAERFVERGTWGRCYATGDVVRIHPAGHVEFGGRADSQVKISGHRIELGEIETVLDQHPEVARSVVIVRGDELEPTLVAFVVAVDGATIDAELLRKHVADVLPAVMVPAAIAPLATIPLTPNGKVDRGALPTDLDAHSRATTAPNVPPGGDRERLVAQTWEAALGRPVGRDDNFFEIGGHSLLAVRVFRDLAAASGHGLALTDVFRYPTVRAFAAYLDQLDAGAGADTEGTSAAASASDAVARGARRRRLRAGRGDGDG